MSTKTLYGQEKFQANPVSLKISRSKFDMGYRFSGTCNAGELRICYYQEVQPGDTFKYSEKMVCRSTTPVCPTMDGSDLDVYYFFVPYKLLLSRRYATPTVNDYNQSWEGFIGAQDFLLNMPAPASGVQLPVVYHSMSTKNLSAIATDFGLPLVSSGNSLSICALPYMAYMSVWNDYFRDPNVMNPVTWTFNSGGLVGFSGGVHSWNNTTGTANLNVLPVCRHHGYLRNCLPWPQRNLTSVGVPFGGLAPIETTSTHHDLGIDDINFYENNNGVYSVIQGPLASDQAYGVFSQSGSTSFGQSIDATNLAANVSLAAPTINQLRYAVQTQKWFEELARCGNRLGEMTAGMFGVTPHDIGDHEPIYLGGKRIQLTQHLVANTSGTNYSTTTQQSLGSTGAYSLTNSNSSVFTKSFDTWGVILGVYCIRVKDSFTQGLDRIWTRRSREQFYFPTFANIGEQPVYTKEIYCDGSATDDVVFGYQEAWADLRFRNDIVTGELRDTLAYWTYANKFSSAPTLAGFIDASKQRENVDQTLQVRSYTVGGTPNVNFQYMVQFKHDVTAVRAMPTYSIPGRLDHN